MEQQRFNGLRLLIVALGLAFGCGCDGPAPAPDSKSVRVDGHGDPLPAGALQRLGSLRFLPRGLQVDLLTYSSSGQYVATACYREAGAVLALAHVWDRRTGHELTPASLRSLSVSGFAWAPGPAPGSGAVRFLTSHRPDSNDPGLNLWTIGQDQPRPLVPHGTRFSSVAWGTGDRIAVWTEEDQIALLDLDGRTKWQVPFAGRLRAFPSAHILEFTPDGRHLAVPSASGVELLDVENGRAVAEIHDGTEHINSVRFVPSPSLDPAATSADSPEIALATSQGIGVGSFGEPDAPLRWFGEQRDKSVQEVALSPDRRWIATSGFISGGPLEVWDFATGEPAWSSPFTVGGGLVFSPDGAELATAPRRLQFLKAGVWKEVAGTPPLGRNEPNQATEVAAEEGPYRILQSGLIQDGRFWTGEVGPALRAWNLDSGEVLQTLLRPEGTTFSVADVGEDRFAVAGQLPEIDLLDRKTGASVSRLAGHAGGTFCLAFAPPSKTLLSAGNDGDIRAWDVATGKLRYAIRVRPPGPSLNTLVVAPNGDFFVQGGMQGDTIRAFRTSDGSPLWEVPSGRPFFLPLAITPDSRRIAAPISRPATRKAGERDEETTVWSIRFLDSATGAEVSQLPCEGALLTAIAISPAGDCLAAAMQQNSDPYRVEDTRREIQLWSLPGHKRLATWTGHFEWPRCLVFTADGRRLVSVSQDATCLVWDVAAATGRLP